MQEETWQSVIVALGILALLSGITITAIRKFSSVDDVLKVIGAFTGILGVITGSFVTYFFTRQPVAELQKQASAYQTRAIRAEQELVALKSNGSALLASFSDKPDDTHLSVLRMDPQFSKYVTTFEGQIQDGGPFTTSVPKQSDQKSKTGPKAP